MQLVCSGISGSKNIRVEEYKRPKFFLTLDKPKGAIKLDKTVKIHGKAITYSGVSVDNSLLKFHIKRRLRVPFWWSFFRWLQPKSEEKEIMHGVLKTDKNGEFTICGG